MDDDPAAVARQACFNCVGAGNVFVARPVGDGIELGCQAVTERGITTASATPTLRRAAFVVVGGVLGAWAARGGYRPDLSPEGLDGRRVAGMALGGAAAYWLSTKIWK